MTVTEAASPLRRQVRTERTKDAIMKAALHVFASQGYAEAGVRDIAARAMVNPALVTRYFGSKLSLFETVLESNLDGGMFTESDPVTFGATLTEAFCQSGREAASAVPMLIFAAGDSAARAVALKLLERLVIAPLTEWFGKSDAADRTAQLLVIITGFFVYRLMLPLPPLQQEATPAMRAWLSRALQDVVDGNGD